MRYMQNKEIILYKETCTFVKISVKIRFLGHALYIYLELKTFHLLLFTAYEPQCERTRISKPRLSFQNRNYPPFRVFTSMAKSRDR